MANPPEEKGDGAAAGTPASGGFKAWLPLWVTILLMPVLAYGLTIYVLLPKLQKAKGGPPAESGSPSSSSRKFRRW